MNKKERARAAELALAARYPEAVCSLEWGGDSFRLLIMAILSAQCTDARVNLVSQTLFARYGDAYALAAAPVSDIENEIHSVGLYRSKALALSECSRRICEVYGGRVPHEMADLLTLRGVGRKVANLVRGDAFGLGGIVADTHCIRICGRLSLSGGRDPLETERSLEKLIPRARQSDFCHRLVLFGREVCTARAPKCAECPLFDICPGRKENPN
mgnify:FL=1